MTREQIDFARSNRRLKLDNWDAFTHYMAAYSIFAVPITLLCIKFYNTVKGGYIQFTSKEITIMLCLAILAVILYILQRHRLKFKQAETDLPRETLHDIINMVAQHLGWTIKEVTDDYVIATTSPGFFSGSWGERITIVFDKNVLLVNSICDPDKNSSLTSMGRNRRNASLLLMRVKLNSEVDYL